MKILVAIPVYDGKLPVETVRCLLEEQILAAAGGDEMIFRFLSSCSHAAMGRNQLAQDFLTSDAQRLVFLDADVTFAPGSILKIARSPVDFVGGAYRFKMETEKYPVGWLDTPELWANEHGLLPVASLPTGFLSLSRTVFERLRAAHPDRWYLHFEKRFHAFFLMPYQDGTIYGEDTYFCKEWRELGGRVFLDPELSLTHWDYNRPYPGHIGNWLKRQAGLSA